MTSSAVIENEKRQITKINDYLYLSGCPALSASRLQALGITCAVNCIKGVKHQFPDHIEYITVPIDDEESVNLSPYFDKVFSTIARHRQANGRVLVYCGLGISRSATFVIAYFLTHYNMPLIDAYKLVQKRRNIICPNVGFFKQLIEMEYKLYGQQTVKIIEPAPGVFVADVVWDEIYQEMLDQSKLKV